MTSYFPDVNVWIALTYSGHVHHSLAQSWFSNLDEEGLYFCRFTQMGLLRLLTQPAVMKGQVRTQPEAWQAYDQIRADERVLFLPEPDAEQLEAAFRRLTVAPHRPLGSWSDAYLSALAEVSGTTLVTFDRGLHRMTKGSVLLS